MSDQERPSDLSIFLSRMRRTPWRKALRQAWRSRGRDGVLLPERLEGAVYGHLCGDALGVPYEFRPASDIGEVTWRGGGTHGLPAGTWSDDGALMLALLDSLLEVGFDTADQGRRAVAWHDEGSYAVSGQVFDVGNATCAALARLRAGTPADEAGAASALGNGSLMRILPLALVFRDTDRESLLDMAFRASSVTHGSAEAQIACGLYALVASRLLAGEQDRQRALAGARTDLRAALRSGGLPGGHEATAAANALATLDAFEAWPERSGRGRVVDSFWSAWDAFASAPDYPAAVVRAVEYGNDTDTTAAIAGGLAGAYFGIAGVPLEWHRSLRDRPLAQRLIDRLIETDTSEWGGTAWNTSSSNPLRVDLMDLDGSDLADGPGRAGMTFLPGKRYLGYYSGPQWRDLDSDLESLKDQGVDVLLLLVEDKELVRCRVTHIEEAVDAHGLELVRHPVPDPMVPDDDAAYRRMVTAMVARVRSGQTLAIACRGGLDRTGMTSACLLREAGLDADAAIDRVHTAREHTLTMPEQLDYVRGWPHA
ncbi:MAG: ADP-ribosylglycohydrolase family protein [Chloroflexota bacterium]|jgi:ADP-ribosylglycohydrolase